MVHRVYDERSGGDAVNWRCWICEEVHPADQAGAFTGNGEMVCCGCAGKVLVVELCPHGPGGYMVFSTEGDMPNLIEEIKMFGREDPDEDITLRFRTMTRTKIRNLPWAPKPRGGWTYNCRAVDVAKQKDGPTGLIVLGWEGKTVRWFPPDSVDAEKYVDAIGGGA